MCVASWDSGQELLPAGHHPSTLRPDPTGPGAPTPAPSRRREIAPFAAQPAKVAYKHAGAEVSSSHRRRTSRSSGIHVQPDASFVTRHRINSVTAHPFHEEDELASTAAFADSPQQMSLDRSPSPRRGGGWSSPGLSTPIDETGAGSRSRGASPRKGYGELNGGRGVTWATAKAGSARVNGYPSYQSQNQGFFGRHMRRISSGLPQYFIGAQDDRYGEKEKLGRGRSAGRLAQLQELPRRLGLLISRRRKQAALLVIALLMVLVWFSKRKSRRVHLVEVLTNVWHSFHILVEKNIMAGRRQQVCGHTRCQPRRRRDGVEGTPRMGDRKRQREK